MLLVSPKRTLFAVLLLILPFRADASGRPAKVPQPLRIDMEQLGYQPPPPISGLAPASMTSVYFVDPTHLLVTFNVRTLLTRLPDEAPGDEDSNVAALLLELPSGKVLARTQWRLRDRRPYLWPLGNGRFLVRIRSQLSVIAPLANLQADRQAFMRTLFLAWKRRIAHLEVSPSGDLLTVESVPQQEPKPIGGAASAAALAAIGMGSSPLGDPPPPDRNEDVLINFYRLKQPQRGPSAPSDPVLPLPINAGVLHADMLLSLPVTSAGYLYPVKEAGPTWDFDFYTHTGKKIELAPFDTSCKPQPLWVSPSEFIAFGCRGSADRVSLGAFNMKGEQMWIQNVANGMLARRIPTAPAAGRYLLSRAIFGTTPLDTTSVRPEELSAQEIVVTQTWDGRELLKLQTTPIQADGRNVDLSPDGLSLVLLRNGFIEVYPLPPLTDKDREQIALAAKLAPENNDETIRLSQETVPIPAPKPGVLTLDPDEFGAPPAPVSVAAPAADVPPDTPRKAPTLYAPGEAPQK